MADAETSMNQIGVIVDDWRTVPTDDPPVGTHPDLAGHVAIGVGTDSDISDLRADFEGHGPHGGGNGNRVLDRVVYADDFGGNVQAAVDTLTDGSGVSGGKVILGGGTYKGSVDSNVRGVTIVGQGLATTRLLVPASAKVGLRLAGDRSAVRDLRIEPADPSKNQIGVLIDDAQHCRATRLHVFKFGSLIDAYIDVEDAPAGFRVQGATRFADWMMLTDSLIERNYRNIAMPGGGAQLFIDQMNINKARFESVFIQDKKRGGNFGGCTLWANQTWFNTGAQLGQAKGIYHIVLSGLNKLHHINSELGKGAGGRHHILANGDGISISDCWFAGGGDSNVSPHAVYFGPKATNCDVGLWWSSGSGAGKPDIDGDGNWQGRNNTAQPNHRG